MLTNLQDKISSNLSPSLLNKMWSMYLWGASIQEIYEALRTDYDIKQSEVRESIQKMKEELQKPSFEDLSSEEVRTYLARNALIESELITLYFEAKEDYEMLRTGNIKYEDGRRVMPTDVKTLQGLLAAIEKQSNTRASVVSKLAEDRGDGAPSSTNALPKPSMSEFFRDEEVIDAEFIEK